MHAHFTYELDNNNNEKYDKSKNGREMAKKVKQD